MPKWEELKNNRLVDVSLVIETLKSNEEYEFLSGYILYFDSGNFLSFYNGGSEAELIYNSIPPEYPEFTTRIESLKEL